MSAYECVYVGVCECVHVCVHERVHRDLQTLRATGGLGRQTSCRYRGSAINQATTLMGSTFDLSLHF